MYGIYDGSGVIAKFAAPLSVDSNKPVSVSDTLSLKRHSVSRTAQRWEISATVEPLSSGANKLFALLVTKGFTETFQILVPQNYGAKLARTSVSTSAAASNLANAGSSQVIVKNNAGTIPVGTMIRFANHTKVYMVTSDLVGNGAMNVFPELRVDIPANTEFNFKDDVIMNAFLETDAVRGMVYEDGILMSLGQLKFVEDVR